MVEIAAISGKIGGFPILGSSPARWVEKAGVDPYVGVFDLKPDHADVLFKGFPVRTSLEYDLGDGNPVIFNNLWVLRKAPGPNPFISRIVIADRRWLWPYAHFTRRYNMRRRVGFRRVKELGVPELDPVVSDIWYAHYSMQNPQVNGASPESRKWVAKAFLTDIMEAIRDAEQDMEVAAPILQFNIASTIGELIKNMPIENIETDDTADKAIARALSTLPEAKLILDRESNVEILPRTDGAERQEIRNLGPEMVDRGHIDFVLSSAIRPRRIEVLFTREIEVRYNFTEPGSKNDSRTVILDDRILENVLPVPDHTILINGQNVPQGTWVEFSAYLNAINEPPFGPPPKIGRIDYDILRKAFIPHMDLWGALNLFGQRDPDNDWGARLAAMQAHWRRTFRIPRRRMDRTLKIRAYRVATIDPESGQRAPAEAYSDYAVVPSMRTHYKQVDDQSDLSLIVNIDGYPDNDLLGPTTKPAPARVSIVDEDQGIIHIDYIIDPWKRWEQILPGKMDATGLPNADIVDGEQNITFDMVIEGREGTIAQLESGHKVALIVTQVPAAPNTRQQLHKVVVTPNEVKDMLPPGVSAGLGDDTAKGPVMQVRVGAGIETARVQWNDGRAADIDLAFGLPQRDQEPNLEGLVVNDDKTQAGASLRSISRAVAARIYATFADHFEGSATGKLTAAVSPKGWIDQVTHEINAAGEATTGVTLPPKLDPFDLTAFLDDNTRSFIIREAQG